MIARRTMFPSLKETSNSRVGIVRSSGTMSLAPVDDRLSMVQSKRFAPSITVADRFTGARWADRLSIEIAASACFTGHL